MSLLNYLFNKSTQTPFEQIKINADIFAFRGVVKRKKQILPEIFRKSRHSKRINKWKFLSFTRRIPVRTFVLSKKG